MNGSAWSESEAASLRDMARGGMSSREIASALGRTASSVSCKAHASGVRISPRQPAWSKDEDDALRGMSGTGICVRDAAERLGRGVPAVYKRAAALGVRLARAVDWGRVERACAGGVPLRDLARELGVGETALYERVYRRYGTSYRRLSEDLRGI